MPAKKIISEHESNMAKAIEFLQEELKAVRTGRASTGLVDNIKVDYYGTATPLKQLATMATPDADMIVIKPFDPASVGAIEKAIKNSDLSIAPIVDSKVIRLNIPPLSAERRTQIVAQIKQMGEQAKVSIRNIRRDANKMLDEEQKNKLITEDDRDKGKKEMDSLAKTYGSKIDSAVKAKGEEIMLD